MYLFTYPGEHLSNLYEKKSRSVTDNISASLKLRKYSRCLALIQSHSDVWY